MLRRKKLYFLRQSFMLNSFEVNCSLNSPVASFSSTIQTPIGNRSRIFVRVSHETIYHSRGKDHVIARLTKIVNNLVKDIKIPIFKVIFLSWKLAEFIIFFFTSKNISFLKMFPIFVSYVHSFRSGREKIKVCLWLCSSLMANRKSKSWTDSNINNVS